MRKHGYERDDTPLTGLPYTIVGYSSLLPSFHVALTGKGLKAIAEQVHEEDMVHLTIHHEGPTTFTVSRAILRES